MGPVKQKYTKPGKSVNEAILGNIVQMGETLETMDIDGLKYFPCQICNRLFKEEKFALSHLQKCKPRIYLLPNEKLANEGNNHEDRDPYEIIPEEIELEGQIVNNNSTNHNKNGLGNFKWRKNFRKCNNNNETEITPKKRHRNSCIVETATNPICMTEPKKNSVQSGNNNLKPDEIADFNLSIGFTLRNEETILKNSNVDLIEKQTTKKKKATLNKEKQRRNYRQLTEQEIEERLKKISERLKKHNQPDTINEEEEEEERREIEERLSVLNKDSEVCVIQNGDEEIDERLQTRKFSSASFEKNLKKRKIGIIPTIFKEISDNLVQQCLGNSDKKNNAILNSISEFNRKDALNSQSEENGVVIITQRPDGQLHGCRKCSQVFLSSLELLRHSRRDHTYPRIIMAPSEIKKFMTLRDRSHCPICEKPLSSTYKSIYVKHLQTHSCVLEHICPICKKKFKRRDHMRAHQKRHIVGDNVELNGNEEMDTDDSEALVDSSQIS